MAAPITLAVVVLCTPVAAATGVQSTTTASVIGAAIDS